MKFYSHHIGDFDKATRHLTRIERSIYRDLLDLYYDTEAQISLDLKAVCRLVIARSNEEATAVEQVLNEFFTETPTGWYHDRCEDEIASYHANTSQKALAGKASAEAKRLKKLQALNGAATDAQQPLKPVATEGNGASTNHEPLTTNLKPIKEDKGEKAPRASRLPSDFKPDFDFAREQGIADPDQEAMKFADYWAAQPGVKGTKADWPATWRNWCRNSRDKQPAQGVSIPARSTAANETFAERDARIGRERWEEMTGRTHPDNIKTMPAATQFVEDVTPQFLEHRA